MAPSRRFSPLPRHDDMIALDLVHLRQWIGREETRAERLTTAIAARFNATFDRTETATEGEPAPDLIHLCLAPDIAPTSTLGPDGHPARGGFLPPVPLPRRMWAGSHFRFHEDIRIGHMVTRRSVVRDVTAKQGRSGPLCLVTVEHRIDSDGALAVTERQDIIYRAAGPAAPPSAAPPAAEAAPEGRYRRAIDASPTLLFRYSALTFNGHRIHYDAPYARAEEGYPGLVVHGPLQATLLLQFAEALRGKRPAQIGFRGLSPLFDTAGFTLNAQDEGDGLRLWTAAEGGPVAMEARAEW
ncbi:HTD2 family dehydratase [Actibacterium sp. D379-3]